jgi:Mg-chelatase subunit ChlD
MAHELNQVDLAFVVDTTGSMGGLIAAAQRQMIQMVAELSGAADVDLRLGVVEYRDHPPQDTMVYRVHPLTGDLAAAQRVIMNLGPAGGGDVPEAVLDGVIAAARELAWRPHARRLAVLVGDAPPHGVGRRFGDRFPDGCPCGETIESAACAAEVARMTLYAIGLTPSVVETFTGLSHLTGGRYFAAAEGSAAIAHLAGILGAEFGDLELDRGVLDVARAAGEADELSVDDLAMRLGKTRHAVSASLVRLRSRGLIETPAPATDAAEGPRAAGEGA